MVRIETTAATLADLLNALIEYWRQRVEEAEQDEIARLLAKDRASEVIVGFSSPPVQPGAQIAALGGEVSTEQATQQMKAVFGASGDTALDVLSKIEPSKAESALPGARDAERDIDRIRSGDIDFSWLTATVRLNATPGMIKTLARSRQVAFVLPNRPAALPKPVEVIQANISAVEKGELNQGRTWGLEMLQVHKLHEQGLTGKGVRIGHIDTGVDASHPALQDRVECFALLDPRGKQVRCEPFDAGAHGTHTAGTLVGSQVGGVAIGVAPGARLASALALMGSGGTEWQLIRGVEWVVDQGVRVMNLSLGLPGFHKVYELALVRAAQMGIFVASSVGNEGMAITGSPGNLGSVCGVGAINRRGDVASFSGGGSVSWYDSKGQLVAVHKPDVVAPGETILSAVPEGGWEYMSGTSMAAPHVAGLAALLVEARPAVSLAALVDAVYASARHPNATEERRDSRYGRGIINPLAALARVMA